MNLYHLTQPQFVLRYFIKNIPALVLLLCISLSVSGAQQDELNKEITIGELDVGQYESRLFQITDESAVRVNGRALGRPRTNELLAYGWILDAASRDVVWTMEIEYASSIDRIPSRRVNFEFVQFDEFITLPAGFYEICFSTFLPDVASRSSYMDIIMRRLFVERRSRQVRDIPVDELGITVFGNDESMKSISLNENPLLKRIAVRLGPAGDNNFIKQPFSVKREQTFQIYTLGEFASFNQTGNDYGWIVDNDTQESVWEMLRSDTDHAGGGDKNRRARIDLTLQEGDYIAYFVTDGSHASGSWNVAPPFDPDFWGLTILVSDDETDHDFIELISDKSEREPIIDFTRLRNNTFISQGLLLDQPARIQIQSIGESNYSYNTMVDFGWIINADTRERVWEMNLSNSEWAGGHRKNLEFNGVISLDPGRYIVSYRTDDSHAYRRWNEAPPFNPDKWGITVRVVDQNREDTEVRLFDPAGYVPENVIAQLISIRNDKLVKKSFSIEEPTRIRIYAIGEGMYGRMTDYGWIDSEENERVIWEMKYRETAHAEGAMKNRVFDGTIMLNSGNYVLYYVSDENHAFDRWNDDPPFDPEYWGITLYTIDR
ncbi:hypothetical protein ACFL6I_08350 [candidate division KSB1 bacterium]